MSKDQSPDMLFLVRTHVMGLRDRNTELLALLYGALSLLRNNDEVNGIELLEIAIDRTGDVGDFRGLSQALDQLDASHD